MRRVGILYFLISGTYANARDRHVALLHPPQSLHKIIDTLLIIIMHKPSITI